MRLIRKRITELVYEDPSAEAKLAGIEDEDVENEDVESDDEGDNDEGDEESSDDEEEEEKEEEDAPVSTRKSKPAKKATKR